MKIIWLFLLSVVIYLIVSSCNTGPKSINYGSDGCHYCKMTIVDKIHGAEIVTKKGKVLKFDAAECMFNYTQDNPKVKDGIFYTNYYEKPEAIIPVADATFLISETIPSPMGANLTAFGAKERAVRMQSEKGGKLYTWKTLKAFLEE